MIVIILDIFVDNANPLFIINLLYKIAAIVVDAVLVIKDMLKDSQEVDVVDSFINLNTILISIYKLYIQYFIFNYLL